MREQRVVLEPFGLSEILQCSGVVCANQHGFMMVKGYMKKRKGGGIPEAAWLLRVGIRNGIR